MLDGSTTDDILIGGEGDDTLIGNGGNDTFVYKYENAGNDFIDDFTVGNTNTNTNADIIDLRDLLIGYNASNLSDFITVTAVDSGTKLTIDHDGGSVNNNAGADSKVSITLAKVTYKADLLASLIANGNLVLKATSPTLTIINSGGTDTTANTITFNFSKAIRNESFTVDDIGIEIIWVVFLAMAVLALPTISVKVFAATVIATLECCPPRLGVTTMVY
jgi:hypothetical protein